MQTAIIPKIKGIMIYAIQIKIPLNHEGVTNAILISPICIRVFELQLSSCQNLTDNPYLERL